MKTDNIVLVKSFEFAVRVVKAYQYLYLYKKEHVLSKQFVRSGTSIAANIEESIGAYSKQDFLFKITIAYKEARECRYWIRLLHATGYLSIPEFESLFKDVDDLCRLIGKIQVTLKKHASSFKK